MACRSQIRHAQARTRQLLFFYTRRFPTPPPNRVLLSSLPTVSPGSCTVCTICAMNADVAVRIPQELDARLDELAKDEQRSRANAARRLISEGLERRETVPNDDDRRPA